MVPSQTLLYCAYVSYHMARALLVKVCLLFLDLQIFLPFYTVPRGILGLVLMFLRGFHLSTSVQQRVHAHFVQVLAHLQ